jgi:hypothetical protein
MGLIGVIFTNVLLRFLLVGFRLKQHIRELCDIFCITICYNYKIQEDIGGY